MKIKYIFILFVSVLALSSCGSRMNNAVELTVPILQAIKSDDACKLEKMLPPEKTVNTVFEANKGTVGYCYYNKYTKDYREKHLIARVKTNLEIIKTISENEGLDWDNVKYTEPKKKDISDSASSYTIVTTNLKFPNDKEYELSYTAANADNKWFLLDDIYFGIKPADTK